jgi:phage FluMu protein Com
MRTKKQKKEDRFWAWVLLICGCALAIWIIPVVRWIFVLIGVIVVGIFIYRYTKRKHKYERGEVYSIEHQCPNCGRMNTFHYPLGSEQGNVTIRCHYCGRSYTK